MKTYRQWKKEHEAIRAAYDWEVTEEIHNNSENSWNEFYNLVEKSDDFLYEAIKYELANHEYCYDYNFDVFEFLGIKPNPRTVWIFNQARKDYFKNCDF